MGSGAWPGANASNPLGSQLIVSRERRVGFGKRGAGAAERQAGGRAEDKGRAAGLLPPLSGRLAWLSDSSCKTEAGRQPPPLFLPAALKLHFNLSLFFFLHTRSARLPPPPPVMVGPGAMGLVGSAPLAPSFPALELGLSVLYTLLYAGLFLFTYLQLWLLFYYREKRLSYRTVCLFLCLLWAALRTVLFSFYLQTSTRAVELRLQPFPHWLLFCFPVCLLFATNCLLNLYFAEVSQWSPQLGRRRLFFFFFPPPELFAKGLPAVNKRGAHGEAASRARLPSSSVLLFFFPLRRLSHVYHILVHLQKKKKKSLSVVYLPSSSSSAYLLPLNEQTSFGEPPVERVTRRAKPRFNAKKALPGWWGWHTVSWTGSLAVEQMLPLKCTQIFFFFLNPSWLWKDAAQLMRRLLWKA